jgi:predicted Zn finger-like uncharacterized protein
MDAIAIECSHCNARLKIKASSARTPLEVKCPKCGKTISVQKNTVDASSVPPKPATTSPAPAAPPAPVTPPTPVAPVPPPPVVTEQSAPKAQQPVPLAVQPAPKKAAAPIVLNTGGEQAALTIPVKCPSCHWQTKVAAPLIGKKIRCKQCGAITPVNAPEGYIPPTLPPPAALSAVIPEPAVPQETPAPKPPPAPAPLITPVAPPMPTPPPETTAAPVPPPVHTAPPPAAVEPPPPPKPAAPTPPAPAAAPAPVKPKTDSGQVTLASIALQNEIAELKAQLQVAHHQADEAVRKATAAAQRTADAERISSEAAQRVSDAEKMLHDMAGQKALETMATNRKIAELEGTVLALQQVLSSIAKDFQAELVSMEKRAATVRSRLSTLGVE